METPAKRRVALRVKGQVQGVFFRQSAQDEALRLGVTGWVRNRRDGDVEAVAEGTATAIERFVAWCRRGPPYAEVTELVVEEIAPTGEFRTFRIER